MSDEADRNAFIEHATRQMCQAIDAVSLTYARGDRTQANMIALDLAGSILATALTSYVEAHGLNEALDILVEEMRPKLRNHALLDGKPAGRA